MKKCGTYIVILLMILFSSNISVCSAQVSRKKLESVEAQVHVKEMELKKKQAESVALSLELAKLNKQMIQAAKKIQTDEEKTTKMEKELEELESKLEVLEQDFNKEHKNLTYILASMQNLALYPSETLIVQPLTPVEIIQSAILMRETVPYVYKHADKLRHDVEKLENQRKKVNSALENLEKQKNKMISQQKELKKMAEQKSSIRKQVETESLALKNQAQKLALEAADLKELVEKLEKDEELKKRRSAEIKKAAKKREQEAFKKLQEEQIKRIKEGKSKGLFDESGTSYVEDDSQDYMEDVKVQQFSQNMINFASAKGRLSRPARGEIITFYGNELSKGVTSKGIVIKTRANAQVIAPYDGSVIFSGPFKGYGNLIIIDHSKGYVSLLAGLEAIDVQTGQMLLAGEPVGIMPDGENAKLYIEIRKDQNPITPEPWFEK